MPHPVVHWEIGARDAAKQRAFYSNLFGWRIDADSPMSYGAVEAADGGIGGGIMQVEADVPPYLTFYVQVDDLDAYLERAQGLGATTLVPPMPIPGVGAFALFQDPEGNVIGLFKR